MKKLTLALVCALPLIAQAELIDNSTQTKKVVPMSDLTIKKALLLGTWQCQSSPQMDEEYEGEVSATYQFLFDGTLKVSKVSKVNHEQGEGVYHVDTERRWQLYQEADLLLIAEQNTALTRFDSHNVDPVEVQNLQEFAKDTSRVSDMIVGALDKTTFNFGYTNGIVTKLDVFRCQRVNENAKQ